MTRVFVSGAYGLLHPGHISFFKAARVYGDHLTVCFADDATYRAYKKREPPMPELHRRAILEELRCVDAVVMGSLDRGRGPAFDFAEHFMRLRPDVLVTTADDSYAWQKQALCDAVGARLALIPKPTTFNISTTAILERIRA